MTTTTPTVVPFAAGTGDGREPVSHADRPGDLPEPDRAYPVVLKCTQRRVVLVAAETAQDAHRIVAEAPFDYWPDADADADHDVEYGGDLSVDRSWPFDLGRHLSHHQFAYGPLIACPGCGRTADIVHPDAPLLINHDPACTHLVHHVTVTAVWEYDRAAGGAVPGGWLVRCNCAGPRPADHQDRHGGTRGGTVVADRDTAVALARAHVAGRLHTANPALAIPDRSTPTDPGPDTTPANPPRP